MNASYRELRICLLLGGIGSLISFLLYRNQSSSYSWMPLLMTCMTVASIGFLVLGFLVALRKNPNLLSILSLRMACLTLGIVCLSLVGFAFMSPEKSQPIFQAMLILMGLIVFPFGCVLSAFGLFLDSWLSRSLRVSRWRIYLYAVRLCCISVGLSPILTLIVLTLVDNSTAREVLRDSRTIRSIIVLVGASIIMFLNSEKYLRD
jgi:hypothetical protein